MAGIWHWRYSAAAMPRGGGEATEIAPASAAHGHAAMEAPVTQAHAATVASAGHSHQADTVSLAQMSGIVIAAGLHGLTGDAPSVFQLHALWPQDSGHAPISAGAGVAGAAPPIPPDRIYVPRRHGGLRPPADERLIITET